MKLSILFSTLIAMTTLAVQPAEASAFRKLTHQEITSVNWILQCPTELADITRDGKWVGDGTFSSGRKMGTQMSYRFFRQVGFTRSEYVGTLNVRRVPLRVPRMDAPNYRVECSITVDPAL